MDITMKFYLGHKRFEKAPIFIDVTFRKLRFRFTTGISVNTSNWNPTKQRVESKDIDYALKNHKLLRIADSTNKLISNSKYINENITIEEFKTKLLQILNPNKYMSPENSSDRFVTLFENWINRREQLKEVSPKTIENYRNALRFMKKYETHCNIKVHLYDLNNTLKDSLTLFAFEKLDLTNSTLFGYYKIFKQVSIYLNNNGFQFKNVFSSIGVNNKPNNEQFTLTKEQRKLLINFKVENQSDELYHDLAVLQLDTLQRISDVSKFNSNMVKEKNGKKYLSLETKKTETSLVLPFTKRIEFIFNKYGGKIPPFKVEVYNKKLKQFCKTLNFDN
jgi:site-specific recombinase XerD